MFQYEKTIHRVKYDEANEISKLKNKKFPKIELKSNILSFHSHVRFVNLIYFKLS